MPTLPCLACHLPSALLALAACMCADGDGFVLCAVRAGRHMGSDDPIADFNQKLLSGKYLDLEKE